MSLIVQEIRELKDRIRELEAENKLWRDGEKAELKEVQSFQARIRELEARLKDAGYGDHKRIRELVAERDKLAAKIVEFALLEERIAKAREILKTIEPSDVTHESRWNIAMALAALEGK